MLQVTQAPQGPVLIKQRFSILGVASTTYAGMALTLTVDGRYRTTGPVIKPNGTWEVDFLFQQTGSRRLKIEISGESTEVAVAVVETIPQAQQLKFTQVQARVPVGQALTVGGTADNYADGAQLVLKADGKFELSRPVVRAGKWQATVGFTQAGKRTLEISSLDGRDRAQTDIEIVEVANPRPPRVSFTNPPKQVNVEDAVKLTGLAENYNDGDQLLLRADQKNELARPRVANGKWESTTAFRQAGNRLIEIIGSEQDKAQTIIEVVGSPDDSLKILSRSTWTSTPTPSDLPNLTPLRITLHHTALAGAYSTNSTQAQDVSRMQIIWNGHVNGNGWADIGYHFIVMPSGRVFEGRSERKRGAHDVVNDGLGISFDGVYSVNTITAQQYQSAVALCTLLCKRYGFKNVVNPVPTPTADFGTRNLPLICIHRDRVSTECPGTDGGRTIRASDIRATVQGNL